MEKEFKLDEKKIRHPNLKGDYFEKDIKEFIRRLKEKFNPQFEDDWAEKEIDKLAGKTFA